MVPVLSAGLQRHTLGLRSDRFREELLHGRLRTQQRPRSQTVWASLPSHRREPGEPTVSGGVQVIILLILQCFVSIYHRVSSVFISTQVFFSMLEIYNEQVGSFCLISLSFLGYFMNVLSCLSRWLTCWPGDLVFLEVSESERSSREDSMWRGSGRSLVRAQRRYTYR